MTFQFESLAAFIHMGGHGIYVWSCYALVYGIFIFLTLSPLIQKNSFLKQQKKWQQLQKDSNSL